MSTLLLPTSRRGFLRSAACGMAAFGMTHYFAVSGAFAEELTRTPEQTEGPFYPDHLPLDTDNDLLILNDAITPGVGQVTHLEGRVLTASGEPIRNAFVEIWQVDNTGSYIHTGGRQPTGKQTHTVSEGCVYTRTTGIWQTVWMEAVPRTSIHDVRWTPNLERWEIGLHVHLDGERIWSKAVSGRFPEPKEIKQLVRDRIAPGRDLGHSDR